MSHYTQHYYLPPSTDSQGIDALCDKLEGYEKQLARGQDLQAAPILNLCNRQDDLAEIEALAAEIRNNFRHVIVCGSGGSGLSGRVLTSLTFPPHQPNIYSLDNIDPNLIASMMTHCPPEQTLVIAISKSGATAETLSQFYALLAHFKQHLSPERLHEHFIVITTTGHSPMRQSAAEHRMRILDHPSDIGGRFSLFTSVGLLPAAIAGIDIRALRQGAAHTAATLGTGLHPARLGAALQYAALQQGCVMSVMLPYCERLAGFSAWYRQSWAESLSKDGKGSTPITAVGTTDQHSQLQLYLAGPNDKFFTMILHRTRTGSGQIIDAPDLPELAYLRNKTTGDIMAAEQQATLDTLVAHGRMVRVMSIDALQETILGSLVMHFMLEIFFMAQLHQVNAFDQPAVEEGKQRAHHYLLGQ